MLRGYHLSRQATCGSAVTVPGAARSETGRAAKDGRESHNPKQDGEFMAVRLRNKVRGHTSSLGSKLCGRRYVPNI